MSEDPNKNYIFTELIYLHAQKCVTFQFVLVFNTWHFCTYSQVFYSCFQGLQEVTLVCLKCATQFWQGLYHPLLQFWPCGSNFFDLLGLHCKSRKSLSLLNSFESYVLTEKVTISLCAVSSSGVYVCYSVMSPWTLQKIWLWI